MKGNGHRMRKKSRKKALEELANNDEEAMMEVLSGAKTAIVHFCVGC